MTAFFAFQNWKIISKKWRNKKGLWILILKCWVGKGEGERSVHVTKIKLESLAKKYLNFKKMWHWKGLEHSQKTQSPWITALKKSITVLLLYYEETRSPAPPLPTTPYPNYSLSTLGFGTSQTSISASFSRKYSRRLDASLFSKCQYLQSNQWTPLL